MKKIILIAVVSLMACMVAVAQEKGPTVVETENFSVKVPKGWIAKEVKSGSISSVSLVPEVKPKESTNFGYAIDIWSFVSRTYTVEKIIDEALKRYGENASEKKEDITFGANTFQRTFFDEGHGTSQTLALPLNKEGAISIDVRSYPLTNKDVKNILKSIKVKK